jgi:lysozyme family protein
MSFVSTYHNHTKGIEGGYANNPRDKAGGETFHGISRKNHPDWDGWPLVDAIKEELGFTSKDTYGKSSTWKAIDIEAKRNSQLNELVSKLYYDRFYKTYMRSEISERLRDKMFDTAVNTGHVNAVKILQRSLNCLITEKENKLSVDGKLGSKTLAAISRFDEDKILSRYATYNVAYYEDWIKTRGALFYDQREAFYARGRWLPPKIEKQ